MTSLAHILWLAYEWRFAMMWIVVPGATLVPFAVAFLFDGPKLRWLRIGMMTTLVVSFVLMVVMMTVGPTLVSSTVFAFGEKGEGVITARSGTDEIYNSEPVTGFRALIRTATGVVVETAFKSSDFNIWPMTGVTGFPRTGQRFSVRYVPGHPEEAVIVSNDDSEYARSLRCVALQEAVDSARRASEFAALDPTLRQRLDRAQGDFGRAGCEKRAASGGQSPSSADKARGAQPAATSDSIRCDALYRARETILAVASKTPRDLALRRQYHAVVQSIAAARCPDQSLAEF